MKLLFISLIFSVGAVEAGSVFPSDSWTTLGSGETEKRISQVIDSKNFSAISDLTILAESHRNPSVRSYAWLAVGYLKVERLSKESEQVACLIELLDQKIDDAVGRRLKGWAARELVARGELQFLEKANVFTGREYSNPSRVEDIMKPIRQRGEIVKSYGNTQEAYKEASKSDLWAVRRWGLERIGNDPKERNIQLFKIFVEINERYDNAVKKGGRTNAVRGFSLNEIKTYNFVISELKVGGRDVLKENLARVSLLTEK